MHDARILRLNSAGFLLIFLAACGSPQTPPAASNAPSDADAGVLAAAAPDISTTDSSASDAGTLAATDAGEPTTTAANDSSAPDPCSKPSADFEQLVRPKFNECYQAGKKKNPNLAGEIRVTLSFDYKGKITAIKHTGNDDLGKSVIACMVDAVKKTTFPNPDACPRKSIMVGKRFGEPVKGTITPD